MRPPIKWYCFQPGQAKSPDKKNSSVLNNLLTGTGLPYKMVNDSLAAIPYEGENIASYQVIVHKISDQIIVYTNFNAARQN